MLIYDRIQNIWKTCFITTAKAVPLTSIPKSATVDQPVLHFGTFLKAECVVNSN